MAALRGMWRTRNSNDNKCNKQFCLSLAEISITRISFHSIYTWKFARKKRTRSLLTLLFFHGKNFTPTPVTFEIKIIKGSFKPFFRCFRGVWRTKSVGLDWSIWVVKKAGKRFPSIRNFGFKLSLNACMHNMINEFGFYKLSFQAIVFISQNTEKQGLHGLQHK